jgi:hypothetical protein
VVGQQGRILLHGPTPVGVGEGGANGGGDRGGVRWSSGRVGGQDQPVDRTDTGDMTSHHGGCVSGVAVNDDGVVHRRLKGHRRGRLAARVDDGGVSESGHVRRGARVCGRRGRSAPAAAVDDSGVGEASHAR